jgi:NAD(P)-dependent dehydrogenase (short-subunit alcohol dehydrogenase family)
VIFIVSKLEQVFGIKSPVALVTGSGALRVGRAIASHLASLGCELAIHCRSDVNSAQQAADELQHQTGRRVLVTQGSLDDDRIANHIVEQTYATFGRVDILVNSAAIWRPIPIEQVTGDDLREYFQVNTVGSFLCAHAAAKKMVRQKRGGCIVNIGDWATVRPYLDHAPYFASKGAIESLTRVLAVEWSRRNPSIRVNCIQPGPVLLADDVPDEVRQALSDSTLVSRIGTADHIAHAVQFLCENDFVTGVCLPVDGGRSIFAPDGLQSGRNTG